MAYRCSKFNAYCLLSSQDNALFNTGFCRCRPSVTLHQGHQNEHEHGCHAQVYRHAKFINVIAQMLSEILQVKQ